MAESFFTTETDSKGKILTPGTVAHVKEIAQSSGVPIFQTLAEAQAWEKANPGKIALTIENIAPDTTAPTAGTLKVSATHNSATCTVTGATDDRSVTGYAYSKDSGTTWSAWKDEDIYAFTGLAASTTYTFRHKVKDAVGHETTGILITATTDAAPAHPYITAAISMNLQHIYALDGSPSSTTNRGTAATPTLHLNSPSYGAGIGGFSQSMTGGSVQINNYLPDGIPAYSIAVIAKTPSNISSYYDLLKDWNNKNSVKLTSIDGPYVAGPSTMGVLGSWKASANTVYHVALTWDGANIALYIDGTLLVTRADPGPVVTSAALQTAAASGSRNGLIIDTTKALTAAQVKQLSDAVTR